MLTKAFFLLTVHLTGSLAAQSFRRTTNLHQLERRTPETTETPSNTKEPVLQYIELPLDHFGNATGTFQNRYWVDDLYYKPGGPVIIYDVGEQPAIGFETSIREGPIGSIADEFNALIITWEHRFYGTSMPNMTDQMTFEPDTVAKYFEFHTIEQALEDIAVFAQEFSFNGLDSLNLRPGNTPWVFTGGSYPGARAAWARIRNPEIFHAALASSAVVNLVLDNPGYYSTIKHAMDVSGYANCSADMTAIAHYIDDAYGRDDLVALELLMGNITGGVPESDVYRYFNDGDITELTVRNNLQIALDAFSDFQSAGFAGYGGIFCDFLQASVDQSENITDSAGVFAEYAVDTAVQIYASAIGKLWEYKLQNDPTVKLPDPNATVIVDPKCGGADREFCITKMNDLSWSWQVCSEFGAFPIMEKMSPQNLLPYTLTSHDGSIKQCIDQFGATVENGPNFEPINERYGGWNMNPSNVVWTDGEFDPWRSLSPNSVEDAAPKRPRTTVIPRSGETPGGDVLLAVVVEGQVHVSDLGNGWNTTASEAHQVFVGALREWLPAFEKHEVGW